ncbi:MAG: glutamine--fructose-6-phosphate transaminase (isomerizing) [Candidatus Heimdallarchaeaceae archaeon]
MCGIVGIIQKEKTEIGTEVIESLQKLEYRGYDSVGIATIVNNKLEIAKDEGTIQEVIKKIDISRIFASVAIGHTRWATHGAPSKENAHPHTDCTHTISIVHNGIIENFQQLKHELLKKGHSFVSQTDSETIVHLIEDYVYNDKLPLKQAIINAIKRLEGTYAVVVISTLEPNKIFCAKKDSPLVIGVNNQRLFCASDIPAFLSYTQQVVLLHDYEFVTLTADGYEIIDLKTNKIVYRKPYTVSWKPEMAQKAGYPHFMLKEIHEQPKTIADYIRIRQESVLDIAKRIHDASKVFFIAAGTAYHSTLTGQHLVRKYAKKASFSVVASEFETIESIVDEDSVLIPVSQSGETMDTIKAIKKGKERGAQVLGIVNVVGSTITRHADHVVYLYAGPEIGVAATKTYLAQTTAMWDIALELGKITGALLDSEYRLERELYNSLPQVINQTIVRNEAKTSEIAKWFSQKSSSFYLGRGINLQTAMEGSLKMKEIAYIHCEAYPAGESKHGPIALIENDFPVVFVAPKDDTYKLIVGNIMEMKARGASIVGVIEEGDDELKEWLNWKLEIPKGYSNTLTTIPYVIPLQMLAYYTAVRKGYDPDKPRNLAKSVTVL